MKYTKEQYLEAMCGYFGLDDEISNEETTLVKTRTEHRCVGIEHDRNNLILAGNYMICQKAIHCDLGRVSCYVCLPCADKWVEVLKEGL